jgi:hypothetical protein
MYFLFYLSVLLFLSCLACSVCPVLTVMFCLFSYAHLVLPVQICLSCFDVVFCLFYSAIPEWTHSTAVLFGTEPFCDSFVLLLGLFCDFVGAVVV